MALPWLETTTAPYDPRRIIHLPLFSLVVKTTIAAGLAYWVGAQLPEQIANYAYYASLGALSVMYPAITDSVREALRAVAAMATGVTIAVLLQWVSWANWLTVALVIGIGTALGGLTFFGSQRSWIPTAGLFTLTTGGDNPELFIEGYLTQIPLGAVVGILVNAILFPPIPLHDVLTSVRGMRRTLVAQLREIADLLGEETVPADDAWRERLRDLQPLREKMRAATIQAHRAQEHNPRAKRHREAYETLTRRAEGLERCSTLIDVVGDVMIVGQHSTSWDIGKDLRERTATTLRDLAEVLDHIDREPDAGDAHWTAVVEQLEEEAEGTDATEEDEKELVGADARDHRVRAAEESIEDLLQHVDEATYDDLESRYVAGSVALAARRCLETFVETGATR